MKIGVILPIIEDSDAGSILSYQQVRELAQTAEAQGLDSVWLPDHLIFRFPDQPERGVWECWTLLAALAEATTRVELGPLVLCLPFRNPALTARMAATLDEVSGGRLILGLGAGWHQPEFDAFGYPFDHLASRFEEGLQVITTMLRDGQATFSGTYERADTNARPRGPRPNGPPILIGAGKPRMLRLIARHADAWNTCWLGDPAALAPRLANLHAACAAENRDPATLDVTVGVLVAYPPDADSADVTEHPGRYLTGTPEQIAAGLRGYADQGVKHIIANLLPCTPETVQRFADAVRLMRS